MTEFHIMVDTETLSSDPNAALIQIGAVIFDPYGDDRNSYEEGPPSDRSYIANIEFQSALLARGEYPYPPHVSGNTLKWWMGGEPNSPGEEARKSLFDPKPMSLPNVLDLFWHWARKVVIESDPDINRNKWSNNLYAWSHGFDTPILDITHKRIGINTPWHYRNTRELRTILDLAKRTGRLSQEGIPSKEDKDGRAHRADWDAWRQCLLVQACFRALYPS